MTAIRWYHRKIAELENDFDQLNQENIRIQALLVQRNAELVEAQELAVKAANRADARFATIVELTKQLDIETKTVARQRDTIARLSLNLTDPPVGEGQAERRSTWSYLADYWWLSFVIGVMFAATWAILSH